MVDVGLQFDLQGQLVLKHVGLYDLFGDLLDGVESVCHLVGCHVDCAELPLSLRLTQHKILDAYFSINLMGEAGEDLFGH